MATKNTQEKPQKINNRPKTLPASAAKGTTVPKTKDKTAAKQKAAAELAAELRKLRVTMKQIVRQLNMRIDNGIAESLRVLTKKQKQGEPCVLPGAKASMQMTKKMRALKIKPGKGKLKDIAHIAQIVEKIADKTHQKP